MFLKSIFHKSGQSVFEYAIILAIITAAISMMQTYIRRGVQGIIKLSADEIGWQQDSVTFELADEGVQHSQTKQQSTSTQSVMQGLSGKHALNVLESNAIIYGFTDYWGDFEQD